MFGLRVAEWALVVDLFNYTLPVFQSAGDSPGRRSTRHGGQGAGEGGGEPILADYCDYFLRVMDAGFGPASGVSATILRENETPRLPVRVVAVHLDRSSGGSVGYASIGDGRLAEELGAFGRWLDGSHEEGGFGYRRVARLYHCEKRKGRDVPTVYIIKPDRIRYWTRSAALRDADEVAADIHAWQGSSPASV